MDLLSSYSGRSGDLLFQRQVPGNRTVQVWDKGNSVLVVESTCGVAKQLFLDSQIAKNFTPNIQKDTLLKLLNDSFLDIHGRCLSVNNRLIGGGSSSEWSEVPLSLQDAKSRALACRREEEDTLLDLAFRSGEDKLALYLINPRRFSLNIPTEAQVNEGDLNAIYEREFLSAFEELAVGRQFFWLEKLSYLCQERGDFMRATQVLNSILCLALDYQFSPEYCQHLVRRLEQVEQQFLHEKTGLDLVDYRFGWLQVERNSLAAIREHAAINLEYGYSIDRVLAEINNGFQAILKNFMVSLFTSFKTPPTPFALVCFNDGARMEMCPHSGIMLGIIIEQPSEENKEYFRLLSEALALKIACLGETAYLLIPFRKVKKTGRFMVTFKDDELSPGLKALKRVNPLIKLTALQLDTDKFQHAYLSKLTDSYYVNPQSVITGGFHLEKTGLTSDGSQEMSERIGSPSEFCRLQGEGEFGKGGAEGSWVNVLTTPRYIFGDEYLVQQLHDELQKDLDRIVHETPIRKQVALKRLQSHFEHFNPWLAGSRLGISKLDVKEGLHLPFQLIFESLAIYYKLEAWTNLERIEELARLGVIPREGAASLAAAFGALLSLRVRLHLFYKEEKEILVHREEAESDPIDFFLDCAISNQLLEIYRVFIPFCGLAKAFALGQEDAFQVGTYHDPSVGRCLDSEEQCIMRVCCNPEDLDAMERLKGIRYKQQNWDEALMIEAKMLDLLMAQHRESPTQELIARLNQLGCHYLQIDQPKAAIQWHRKALELQQKLHGSIPHSEIVQTYNYLGIAARRKGSESGPTYYHGLALEMAEHLHPLETHPDVFISKLYLGRATGDPSRYESDEMGEKEETPFAEAVLLQEQALAQARCYAQDKVDASLVTCLYYLGRTQEAVGNDEYASELYQEALKTGRQIYGNQPRHILMRILKVIGSLYEKQQDRQAAVSYLKESLAMRRELQFLQPMSSEAMMVALNELSCVCAALDQRAQAESYAQEAISIGEAAFNLKTQEVMIDILNNLGRMHMQWGAYVEASNNFGQAITFCLSKQVRMKLCWEMIEQCVICSKKLEKLGHLDEVIEIRKKEVQWVTQIDKDKFRQAIANCIFSCGTICQRIERHQEAYDFFLQCLKTEEELPEISPESLIQTLYALGQSARAAGNLKASIAHLERATTMLGSNTREYIIHLNMIADNYFELEEHEKALEYYQQALESEKTIAGMEQPHSCRHGISFERFVKLVQAKGQLHALIEEYIAESQNRSQATFYFNEIGKAIVLSNLGLIHKAIGVYKEAICFLGKSVQILQRLQGRIDQAEEPNYQNLLETVKENLGEAYLLSSAVSVPARSRQIASPFSNK